MQRLCCSTFKRVIGGDVVSRLGVGVTSIKHQNYHHHTSNNNNNNNNNNITSTYTINKSNNIIFNQPSYNNSINNQSCKSLNQSLYYYSTSSSPSPQSSNTNNNDNQQQKKKRKKKHSIGNMIYISMLGVATVMIGAAGMLSFQQQQQHAKEKKDDEEKEKEKESSSTDYVLIQPPEMDHAILPPVYLTPNEAIKELTKEPISISTTIFRVLQLGIIVLPSVLTSPLLLIPGANKLWWRLLLETVEFSGTCWIKFGQWVSTRPDLFPTLLCEKFSLLHNQCPSHTFEYTKESIESNFKSTIEDLFLYFEKEPMASGAVAQVHKAVTKDGSVVVVKVLHPNVAHYIKTDFTIIYTAMWLFSQVPGMKWLSLPESVLEFGKNMINQVDMGLEASHLNTFIDNFKNNNEVVFPKPCYPLVSKDVLVETFEPGVPIMQYISNNSPFNPTLARIGLDAYMQMMLVDNFIHADLHPGNVLVRDSSRSLSPLPIINIYNNDDDSNKSTPSNPYSTMIKLHTIDLAEKQRNSLPKLILLDVGLVTKLEDQDKSHFKELFIEVVKGNGRAGAELIIKYAREAQCSEQEIYEFKEKMGDIFNHVQNSKLSEVHVGRLLGEILSLVREYHVKLESNFATLVMGTIILEGLGKQLDPNLSLLKAAIPFLFHRQTSYIIPEFFRYLIRPKAPIDNNQHQQKK